MINPLKHTLANRIVIAVALIITILTGLFIVYYTLHNRKSLERYGEISGLSFAESLAQSSLLGVMAAEPLFLEQPFAIAMSNTEVIYIAAYDAEGRILRQSSRISINLALPPEEFAAIMERGEPEVGKPVKLLGETIDDFFAPVHAEIAVDGLSEELLATPEEELEIATQTIGLMRIGFSRKRIASEIRTSTAVGLMIGISVLVAGIILTIVMARRITGPLKDLEAGARRISEGDMDISLKIKTEDEVGAVARAFNAMTRALKETTVSKDYMDNIVGSMNDAMVVVNAERLIETMNSAAEKLLGYDSSELSGVPVDSLFIEASENPFDPSGWTGMLTNPASNLEADYRTKDGRRVPVNISSAPILDRHGSPKGIVIIARDMREINSLLEQLRSHTSELERYQSVLLSMLDDNEKARAETEEERLKTLAAVNSMTEGLIMFSAADNRVALVNPAAKIMLGFEPKEVLTINEVRKVLGTTFESFITGGDAVEDGRLVHDIAIDTVIPRTLRIEGVPVGQAGQLIGSMLVMRDITRERQLDEAKYALISNVSHELRTPLAIISNIISNLLVGIGGPVSDKMKVNLEACQINTKRLSHIIDGLLDISSLDAGKMVVRRDMVNLGQLVEDIAVEFSREAREKKVKLDVDLPDDRVESFCDPNIVSEVLKSLISNAVRYTPEGGSVYIVVKRTAAHIEFSVSDTGIGIPPDEQRSIFEYFHQVGRTYGPGEKGVGLGLSIARLLVERHDGSIGVTSKPGRGSRFYFVIPDPKGDELISYYLREKLMALPDSGKPPSVIVVQARTSDAKKRITDVESLAEVRKTIGNKIRDFEHIITEDPETGEVLIVVTPEVQDEADAIGKAIRVAAKEMEKGGEGIRILFGSVSCIHPERDATHYIDAARKSIGEGGSV